MDCSKRALGNGQKACVICIGIDSDLMFGLNITVLRLGKPLEHLQAALRATFSAGPVEETITTIARQIGYFGYLSYDAIVWVRNLFAGCIFETEANSRQANSIKFITLDPATAKKVTKRAFQFWLAGIAFSLVHGVLKVSPASELHIEIQELKLVIQAARLAKEAKSLRESEVYGEKDLAVEAARETRQSAIDASVWIILCSLTSLTM